jgi:hypothetical protein
MMELVKEFWVCYPWIASSKGGPPRETLLPPERGFFFLADAKSRMFTHPQIWAAIDAIAEAQGISVSALAI